MYLNVFNAKPSNVPKIFLMQYQVIYQIIYLNIFNAIPSDVPKCF